MELTSAAEPSVFVVDDDVSVREALELLIEAAGFSVETFSSPRDFLARPVLSSPSCLVLDMDLPTDNGGLELQARLRQRHQDIPIIFITAQTDVRLPTNARTARALDAGTVEFLTKPFSEDALLDAIHDALDRSYEAQELSCLQEHYASLTEREQQVLELAMAGLSNKQIASELGSAEQTVRAHRCRVMRKMQASTLTELLRMASKLRAHS